MGLEFLSRIMPAEAEKIRNALEEGCCRYCDKKIDMENLTEVEKRELSMSGMCGPCQRDFFKKPQEV